MTAPGGHTVGLGDTPWLVWRSALLRAAGFDVERVRRFAAPAAAQSADAVLSAESGSAATDPSTIEEFRSQYARATADLGVEVVALAGDPMFREAVTWQNPGAVDSMLDPIIAKGPGAGRNASRRGKEAGIVRYLSRYTTKNDTIGFFGPVCWVGVDDITDGLAMKAGPDLLRRRQVFLERWALSAYADTLAADPEVRDWLPAVVSPSLWLVPGSAAWSHPVLIHPTQGRIELTALEAAVLAGCDARTPARVLADTLAESSEASAADPIVRRAEDVLLTLGRLAERGIVVWGIDLPLSVLADRVLIEAVDRIGQPAVRGRVAAGLDRLLAARTAVAGAAGDPAALRTAMRELDEEFVRTCGRAPTQAEGQTYAGRTLCYEETVRDLDLTVGADLLATCAAPLALLLDSARWLSAEIARVYLDALDELFAELAADRPDGVVSLGELWFLGQGMFYGPGAKPVDDISAEFTRRWAALLGLDDSDRRRVQLHSAGLADQVAREFPSEGPGWSAARYHSADIHLVFADERYAVADARVVLGELHAAWNTADAACFVFGHDDPAQLRAWVAEELPPGRLIPLMPTSWPRLTARTNNALVNPADYQLGFVSAPGADPERLIPITAMSVQRNGSGLEASTADGRTWPLVEVFAELLATHAVDAFKLLGSFEHSPRVSIDRMIVVRESWCRPAGTLDFVDVKDPAARYLAVRRWRAELGLPERVFVKTKVEMKPIYVDLSSPAHVEILCVTARAARREDGADSPVTISEMMPDLEQAWVRDADGAHYVSELRLQILDPRTSGWPGPEVTG